MLQIYFTMYIRLKNTDWGSPFHTTTLEDKIYQSWAKEKGLGCNDLKGHRE